MTPKQPFCRQSSTRLRVPKQAKRVSNVERFVGNHCLQSYEANRFCPSMTTRRWLQDRQLLSYPSRTGDRVGDLDAKITPRRQDIDQRYQLRTVTRGWAIEREHMGDDHRSQGSHGHEFVASIWWTVELSDHHFQQAFPALCALKEAMQHPLIHLHARTSRQTESSQVFFIN